LAALAPVGAAPAGATTKSLAGGAPFGGSRAPSDDDPPRPDGPGGSGSNEELWSEDGGDGWLAVVAWGFLAILWDLRGFALRDLVKALLGSLCGRRCESLILLVRAIWACLATLWWIMHALIALALWRGFAWPFIKQVWRALEHVPLTLALRAGIASEEVYRNGADPDNLELAWFGWTGTESQDVAHIQDHVRPRGENRLPTDVIPRSREGHAARVAVRSPVRDCPFVLGGTVHEAPDCMRACGQRRSRGSGSARGLRGGCRSHSGWAYRVRRVAPLLGVLLLLEVPPLLPRQGAGPRRRRGAML